LTALMPEAFVATMPPMVQASPLPGVGGKKNLKGASASFRRSYTTPASATQYRSLIRSSLIAFMRVRSITMPPLMGTAAPQRPVPPPRGTTGMPSREASLTRRETSSALFGRTTMSGV